MEKTKTKNYKNRESRKKTVQRPRDIFIKIIEKNSNQKEMPIKTQETCRTLHKFDQIKAP